MAKGKQSSASTSAPKADQKTVNRKKRTSFERKCLTKASKRLYAGSTPTVFRVVYKVERDLRRKKPSEQKAD